ncbi:hypothetical protein OESDEN_00458 [Oesophagostomum dentatum]|uniref:Phlebovirus glycoprotein G2 fusion domain-containing protein n=1 Tax=Oesophagostomum dentatum TaxID=61180 RepID=A0A0B1TVU6_OESDE|nr:hypothetical protein OESDEN_00458 [Oesophagostomum dentatum]
MFLWVAYKFYSQSTRGSKTKRRNNGKAAQKQQNQIQMCNFELAPLTGTKISTCAVLCAIVTLGSACQHGYMRQTADLICEESNICHYEYSRELLFNKIQSELCIEIVYMNKTIGSIKFTKKPIEFKCVKTVETFTRPTRLENFHVERCAPAGSYATKKCETMRADEVVPELLSAAKYPGYSGCFSGCGGILCGCFMPMPSCSFYRVAYKPTSRRIPVECDSIAQAQNNFSSCISCVRCECSNTAHKCQCPEDSIRTLRDKAKAALPSYTPYGQIEAKSSNIFAFSTEEEFILRVESRIIKESTALILNQKMSYKNSELTGCYNCPHEAELRINCSSVNPAAVTVTCKTQRFTIRCDKTLENNKILLNYNEAIIRERCAVHCNENPEKFELEGTLALHITHPNTYVIKGRHTGKNLKDEVKGEEERTMEGEALGEIEEADRFLPNKPLYVP